MSKSYQKEYRENMSDQMNRNKDISDISDEQKQRYEDNQKKYRDSMTD